MGSLTGFLDFARENRNKESVESRIQHFNEFEHSLTERRTITQAARCMDCGVPFCNSACPTLNLIPDFNSAVYQKQWKSAYEILASTNNLPEITGRVCPAPCESACCSSLVENAVTIKMLELSIIEMAFSNDWVKHKTRTPTGKKIAIIGGGPAGLAAAAELSKLGHQVVVFEKNEVIGGIPVLGIPDYKLSKHIIARRVSLMEKQGVTFKTSMHIGQNYSVKQLQNEFDALCLTIGSETARDIQVQGREYKNIHFAMEFLLDQNRRISNYQKDTDGILATGKNVVVIGGGDTGSDCIGTSIRQQAKSITQLEILPQPPAERTASNPWPEWPNILRVSTSHEEGGERIFSCMTQAFKGENKQVTGVEIVDVKWEEGKPIPIESTKRVLPADLVLLATGFVHPTKSGLLEELSITTNNRGNIETTNYATNVKGVFAAGDSMSGASLVVRAINSARNMSQAVHSYLQTQ